MNSLDNLLNTIGKIIKNDTYPKVYIRDGNIMLNYNETIIIYSADGKIKNKNIPEAETKIIERLINENINLIKHHLFFHYQKKMKEYQNLTNSLLLF